MSIEVRQTTYSALYADGQFKGCRYGVLEDRDPGETVTGRVLLVYGAGTEWSSPRAYAENSCLTAGGDR